MPGPRASSAAFYCRQGNGEAAARELATACGRPLPEHHGVKPTQLFSRNADVDSVNAQARARCPARGTGGRA